MKRRTPGRPARDAQPDQRARILEAALGSFAAHGVAAASLSRVAREAGVTPALINYYFGGRDGLVQAAIEERVLPVILELRERIADPGLAPAELAEQFVRGIFAAAQSRPWLPSLWLREVLTEGGSLRAMLIERVGPLLPRAIAARFGSARRRGRLARGLDPRLLVVSLIGLGMFPLAAESLWRPLLDADDIDRERLLRHTVVLVNRALEEPHATRG